VVKHELDVVIANGVTTPTATGKRPAGGLNMRMGRSVSGGGSAVGGRVSGRRVGRSIGVLLVDVFVDG